jgi:hypothetical protein
MLQEDMSIAADTTDRHQYDLLPHQSIARVHQSTCPGRCIKALLILAGLQENNPPRDPSTSKGPFQGASVHDLDHDGDCDVG